jgi:DNA recombination protein RmuC
MEHLDLFSLIAGIAIGGILYLLSRLNQSSQSEQLKKQVQDTLAALNLSDEKYKRTASDLQTLTLKHEQKISELQGLLSENASALSNLQNSKEIRQKLQEEFSELKTDFQNIQKELSDKIQKLTETQSQNRYLNDRMESQKKDFEDLKNQSHLEFQNLANKILEEKTQKFTASNRESIDSLLKPLGDNINTFKKQVEETYEKENKQRFSLEEKVKELVELNQKLSKDAQNLTSALKGESKKQGNWGEIILESILEKSGLEKNREYKVQVSVQNDEGRRLQPDVIVYLPEERTIIIDSKVSLVAYDRFSSAETREEQAIALKAHVQSVYNHINELGDKRYDTITGTLDFTMMFFPIEPAYLIAIQDDQELWAYAYAKRILLISPTNLIAALKLIADLWKREQQSKNALEIAKQGEKLYDKLVGFLETMEDVGKHINRSQDAYLKAVGQLKDGRGSLIKQAQKMKKLGLNSQKEIPNTLMPFEDEIEEM